ncbi:hypothetical protein KJ665_00410, partial [Patescibacteria group bacterium]|nr:hypothetical protein [Patescibacteria group bacterium]
PLNGSTAQPVEPLSKMTLLHRGFIVSVRNLVRRRGEGRGRIISSRFFLFSPGAKFLLFYSPAPHG